MKRLLFVVALGLSFLGCKAKGDGAEGAGVAPPITIPITELLSAYKANEVRADVQYKGQRLRVTGVVGEVKKDIIDSIYVTVGTGKALEIPEAQCFFSNKRTAEAAALSKGATVTVECKCEGLMMNVIMKECLVVGGVQAAASAIAATKAPTLGDGPSAMDVCHLLEVATVADGCEPGDAGRESATFHIRGQKTTMKGGQIERAPDDATYARFLAGLLTNPKTCKAERVCLASKRTRITVSMIGVPGLLVPEEAQTLARTVVEEL